MKDIRNRKVVYLNEERGIAVLKENEDLDYKYLVVLSIGFLNEETITFNTIEHFSKTFEQAMSIVSKMINDYIFDFY